jgi:hypothetical protein
MDGKLSLSRRLLGEIIPAQHRRDSPHRRSVVHSCRTRAADPTPGRTPRGPRLGCCLRPLMEFQPPRVVLDTIIGDHSRHAMAALYRDAWRSPVYPHPHDSDAPARRPSPRLHRPADAVLGDGLRRHAAGRPLRRGPVLDRTLVQPQRRSLVAGVELPEPLGRADGTTGVRPVDGLTTTSRRVNVALRRAVRHVPLVSRRRQDSSCHRSGVPLARGDRHASERGGRFSPR